MTQEQILSRLLSQISDEFDKSVGSFFYDIDKPTFNRETVSLVLHECLFPQQGSRRVDFNESLSITSSLSCFDKYSSLAIYSFNSKSF